MKEEELRAELAAQPDWTLEEQGDGLAERTGVSLKKSAIDKYFDKSGISRKKKSLGE